MQQYLDLLKDVRENGVYRSDRTGTGCYTVFGRQMRFNLNDDQFPIVTTKKVHLKSIIYELLWFLRGDTNTRYLKENNVKIWDDWADEYGDLGTVYSAPWRRLPLSGEDIVLIKRRNGPKPGVVSVKEPITEKLESEYKGDLKVEHSNLGNPYRIIKQLEPAGKPNSEYLVQFNHTLSTRTVTRPNIRSGTKVNDRNLPTVFGVACIGSCGEFRERDYDLWFNMIARCYNQKNPAYRFYGGLGVYVSPRWLCFANFLDDLSRIPNYEQWRRSERDYELDKDYYGGKCYDIDTCVFLKKNMNHELAVGEQVMATFKDGSSRLFMSKKKLSKFLNASEETLRSYQTNKNKSSKLDGLVITAIDQSGEFLVRRKITQDQIAELIDGLQKNPFSRRHIVTGWIPEFLPDESRSFSENISNGKQALPPCHTLFQFSATPLDYHDRLKLALGMGCDISPATANDISTVTSLLDKLKVPACKLSCQIYQRSADVFLGLPFNIASYALLTKMVAKVTNMVPDSLVWSGGDVHVYSNHLEQVDLQLTRTPRELPKLVIKNRNQSIDDFIYEDFDLIGYVSDAGISAPVAI